MNILKKTWKAAALASVATTLWALTPGCGTSTGAYCNKVCDCQGCSDSELDECVDSIDDAKKAASDEGCSSQFDALLSCINSELTCEDSKAEADGCDAESEELFKCAPTVSGIGKNGCERAADIFIAKIEACGGSVEVGDGEPGECTAEAGAQALCTAACYEAASCDCIGVGDATQCGEDELNTYVDCITVCSAN